MVEAPGAAEPGGQAPTHVKFCKHGAVGAPYAGLSASVDQTVDPQHSGQEDREPVPTKDLRPAPGAGERVSVEHGDEAQAVVPGRGLKRAGAPAGADRVCRVDHHRDTVGGEHVRHCDREPEHVKLYQGRPPRVQAPPAAQFRHAGVAELGGRGGLDARGAALVQLDMLRLAVAVADVLSSHGVPVVVHSTHTICSCGGSCTLEAPARDYRLGLVPVLYGDALPCPGGGAEILSGDRLAVLLAGVLGVDCLVYAGREPGVRGPDGSVLTELDVSRGLPSWLRGAGGFDQTGGMAGKVTEAARAPRGVRVMIVGGSYILEALRTGRAGTAIVR